MAKKWYPVIDYMVCAECGTCVDEKKAPTPVVINAEGCIEKCHGCGNLCPNGAITYVGDDTGWTPPNGTSTEASSCCSDGACGCQ